MCEAALELIAILWFYRFILFVLCFSIYASRLFSLHFGIVIFKCFVEHNSSDLCMCVLCTLYIHSLYFNCNFYLSICCFCFFLIHCYSCDSCCCCLSRFHSNFYSPFFFFSGLNFSGQCFCRCDVSYAMWNRQTHLFGTDSIRFRFLCRLAFEIEWNNGMGERKSEDRNGRDKEDGMENEEEIKTENQHRPWRAKQSNRKENIGEHQSIGIGEFVSHNKLTSAKARQHKNSSSKTDAK